jgi:hypothetical protein
MMISAKKLAPYLSRLETNTMARAHDDENTAIPAIFFDGSPGTSPQARRWLSMSLMNLLEREGL